MTVGRINLMALGGVVVANGMTFNKITNTSDQNHLRAWKLQRNRKCAMLENYIILGWATGGVLSLIIPAYSLFATMNTVAAINSYFYLTNDILLEKYDMNFNTDIMYQPKED